MSVYYGSVDNVIRISGVKPKDIGLATEIELEATIELWLMQASDLIEAYNNQSYSYDTPQLACTITELIVSNMITKAIVNREGRIVKVSDFSSKINDVKLFTSDVNLLLLRLRRLRRVKSMI